MKMSERLERSESAGEMFEIVKECVKNSIDKERAGLMLGLSDMGFTQKGFVGAYHPMGTNIIVMNKTILRRIAKADPKFVKPYTFHILLHEYLHTLGVLDEARTKMLTHMISKENFGDRHMVTKISKDFGNLLPKIIGRDAGMVEKPNLSDFTLVEGFEKDIGYIG